MADSPELPPLPYDAPPVTYEVKVSQVADFLLVEAHLLYRFGDGLLPEFNTGPAASSVYVDEPCWLFRMFGDTTEKRLERAKSSVARWAERELVKKQRLAVAAGLTEHS